MGRRVGEREGPGRTPGNGKSTFWPKMGAPRVILGPLGTENGSKNRPAASIRALWVSKSCILEGPGKVSKNL